MRHLHFTYNNVKIRCRIDMVMRCVSVSVSVHMDGEENIVAYDNVMFTSTVQKERKQMTQRLT